MGKFSQMQLGKFLELKRGYDLPGKNRIKGPYPVVSSSGISDFHQENKVAGPGVITGRYGTIGQVFFVEDDFWPLNTTLYVRDFKGNIPRFAYYFLKTLNWEQFNDKSGVPGVNRNDVHKEIVLVPTPSDQKQIAEILGTLDDKIELNQQMNETLEEMARALFRDWFIDFGPTRRQMDGATDPAAIMGHAFPDDKAAALASLFPARLGENGLPERWLFSDVGSEFDIVMGQSPPGDTYNEAGHGLPFFQGRRDFGFRFPSRRVYCTTPKRVSGRDWTLLSVRAPVGDINRAAEMCAIGRGVGAFLHKDILHSFTYYTGLALRTELQSYDKDGTVFGSINQKQFKSLKVVRPTDGLAVSFDQIIQPIDEKIRANTEENRTLAEIRDLLLPKLMSGEIQLKNAPMVQDTLDGKSIESSQLAILKHKPKK